MESEARISLYLNRFSIVLALLALGFAMIYLLPTDGNVGELGILGIRFNLSYYSFIPLLLALLAVVGAGWIFSTHPIWQAEKINFLRMLPNLMLPFISTLILSIVLSQSVRSPIWWIVFLTGFTIVGLLLRAEYVLFEDTGLDSLGYSILVISFSFGMFLLLTIALKNSNVRMVVQFLLLIISSLFVSFRLLSLHENSKDKLMMSLIASWIVTQLAVGLHYIFIPPIQYGILLTGLLYSLTSWLSQYKAEKKWHQYPEPILMSFVTILLIVATSIF